MLGPILFLDAWDGHTWVWFGLGLIAALLSDIFDGVDIRAASRCSATPKLREVDSWVDGWFCLLIAASAWVAHRETIVAFAPLIIAWLATDLLALTFDWLKYCCFASYHAYSSKLAGLLLFLGRSLPYLLQGRVLFLLGLALVVSIISHLELMVITAYPARMDTGCFEFLACSAIAKNKVAL
ncbi:MAG: hypothetical protein QM758_05550 [Armatimonas sp.]